MTFSPDQFPNRFDHAAAQERLYAFWQQRGLFHSEPDAAKTPYSIVIPPPNVTGALHLGHALNNSLQDILIRARRMQGFNTLWMPGTDHAGIATQAVVEKRLKEEEKLTRHDLGREGLVKRIWQWKDQYEARILGQLQRLGCSCDWQRTRFTLDDVCARAVRQTFFRMFRDGLICRGKRLVNWDTFLQTAISDDEVYHEVVQGSFWHFRYGVIDPKPGEPEFLTIATTRPETMLGDTAVAVHPDPAKALDSCEAELSERLAKAPAREKADIQKQLDDVRARRETHLPLLVKLRDMAADGRKLMLPLMERPIPLICDEWAKPELGSGCVKITPAHDPNDYDVWQRHPEIGAVNILRPDGTLNENAGPYAGLTVDESRRRVVADMESRGLLEAVEDREIDLAHSDRSKTPIEPFLADQWFVKMGDHDDGRPGLAQSAMDAVRDGRVRIVPERYAKSYLDWLGEKRDWCISRQLWWGHRIPVWHEPSAPAESADASEQRRKKVRELVAGHPDQIALQSAGISDSGDNSASGAHLVCIADEADELEAQLDALGYRRDDDVLDTWFSSALWPHSTFGWPEKTPELAYYYPTSALVTSRDIITLWVARMVISGLYNMGDVPFREVYIHPKILDGYGETMSKSKGNGVDPLDVIDKFGADALRFGLAYLTTESQDVRMPVQFECPHCQATIDQTRENRELPRVKCPKCRKEFATQWARDDSLPRGAVVSERFELARNFCNKLWNASRFALLKLGDYEAAAVSDDDLAAEDRWILSRLAWATETVTDALAGYRFADAARSMYAFAWDDFCSFYLEVLKGRFQDDAARPTAQRVLAFVLDNLLRLLHPIVPFLTEEVWQLLNQVAPRRGLSSPEPASESIMVAPWPQVEAARRDESLEESFAALRSTLTAVNEVRSRQNIPPKKAIEFAVRCDAPAAELLSPMAAYFQSLANATATAWGPDVTPPPMHASGTLPGIEVLVDLEQHIDVPAEIARNKAQADKLLALIRGKEKQLADERFVGRAPAQVVERERANLRQAQEQLASVEAALARLSSR